MTRWERFLTLKVQKCVKMSFLLFGLSINTDGSKFINKKYGFAMHKFEGIIVDYTINL